MSNTVSLDKLVSISELSHGGVGRAISRVGDGDPVVVMKNNKPAAVIITPDDYRRFTEAEEDFALYLDAEERMASDDGARYTMEDAFGHDYRPVDDGFEPEFE